MSWAGTRRLPFGNHVSMRLFDEGEPIPLKLLSSTTFTTGVLDLVYGPADPPADATYDDAKVHIAQGD